MSAEINWRKIEDYSKAFKEDPKNILAMNAVTKNEIQETALSKNTLNKVRFVLKDMSANWGYSPIYNVRIANPPTSDFDGDGDVDQEDFGHLQGCYAADYLSNPECNDADLDGDYDVDMDDAALFQQCLGGAKMPIDPGCPLL